MKSTTPKAVIAGLFLFFALAPRGAPAQTARGDVLRGQGRFLEGAGWYNFNTARADRINVETWKAYNREVQRLYRDYMKDRSEHIQYKKGQTKQVEAERIRNMEAEQRRWRESPNPTDISSGNALNAIALISLTRRYHLRPGARQASLSPRR